MDQIDAKAWGIAKTLVVTTLKTELGRLRKNPEFLAKVSGKAKINLKEFQSRVRRASGTKGITYFICGTDTRECR